MREYRSKEIYGDLYENGNKPLIIVIGGSKAGLPTVGKTLLDYLIPNYNVLLLAYFGVGNLARTLERVPVEYFVNATNLVKERLNLRNNQVVLIGNSKGAEIALLLSKYMASSITIGCVPSCYVFHGLPIKFLSIMFPKSSWSLNKKDLPYIRFYFDRKLMKDIKTQIYSTSYEKSIEKNFRKDAAISIDGYKGKILLLSAENDRYWPSKKMSNALVENSKNKDSIKHIVLDLEGHHYLEYAQSINEIISFLKLNESSLA